MAIEGNFLFGNVKTRWIFILNFIEKIMEKYRTLLVKMTLKNPRN